MISLSKRILEDLKKLDTPTVCNALEVVCPNRRTRGFNVRPFICAHPELSSIVGFARTARIRTTHKPERTVDFDGYYTYISGNNNLPTIAVIQDIDEIVGYGAFWGEVNTNVHYGLGCIGVITNGSIRDIPDSQKKFQMLAGMINPSHAWAHVIDWGKPVSIHGMDVEDGNLIHADLHGAVVIPTISAKKVIDESKKIQTKEKILIQASQKSGFNIERLREAWKSMEEIH